MSSCPLLTDEVPLVDPLGQCALCDEVFPFVNVLRCRRLKDGDVPICLTCHQRFHPACNQAQSILCANHFECRVCGAPQAAVVCTLCSLSDSKDEILDGVQMCEPCSDQIHSAAKRHHTDHFYPVASPAVICVKGPIPWHSVLDMRVQMAANQQHLRNQLLRQQALSRMPPRHDSATQRSQEDREEKGVGQDLPLEVSDYPPHHHLVKRRAGSVSGGAGSLKRMSKLL